LQTRERLATGPGHDADGRGFWLFFLVVFELVVIFALIFVAILRTVLLYLYLYWVRLRRKKEGVCEYFGMVKNARGFELFSFSSLALFTDWTVLCCIAQRY
jgi:hypothetical protein